MKSNRELKEEFKQIKQRIGVFQLRNTVNGKLYIEASVNLDKIWNRHLSELKMNGHRNGKLQKEWNEFGADNFAFEILSEIEQKDEDVNVDYAKEAKQLAKMFMDELQPFGEKGYN